jgi:hypothetical protein
MKGRRDFVSDVAKYTETLLKGEIPEIASSYFYGEEFFSDTFEDIYKAFGHRATLTRNNVWVLVDLLWTKELAYYLDGRSVLEVMGGQGYLAKALAHHGVNIHSTDIDPSGPVIEVEKLSAVEAVLKYSDRDILLMSWPPYDDGVCEQAASFWTKNKEIIVIGEGPGGCTGSDKFWRNYRCKNIKIRTPSWPGTHDRLYIGTYKE